MSDGGVALRSITVGADEDPAEAPARESAVAVLAAGAVVVDDRLTAAAELLVPFRGQLIVVGMGTHVHGAVDRFLAIAAAAHGRIDEAEGLFAAAGNLEEQMSASTLAARTRYWWMGAC
jgi:hypothetical protein